MPKPVAKLIASRWITATSAASRQSRISEEKPTDFSEEPPSAL